MQTTSTMSGRRLKKSPGRISDLDPAGETDFLKFYQENNNEIDQIILAQARSWPLDYNDFSDLRQDVVLKLHLCNVLARFNPDRKIAFNTYLTVFIFGYVRHWFKINRRKHIWKPYPTQGQDEKLFYQQSYFESLNGKEPFETSECSERNRFPRDLTVTNMEARIEAREILGLFRECLTEEELKVLKLTSMDLTQMEIARIFGTSNTTIALRLTSIRAKGQKKFHEYFSGK